MNNIFRPKSDAFLVDLAPKQSRFWHRNTFTIKSSTRSTRSGPFWKLNSTFQEQFVSRRLSPLSHAIFGMERQCGDALGPMKECAGFIDLICKKLLYPKTTRDFPKYHYFRPTVHKHVRTTPVTSMQIFLRIISIGTISGNFT